MTLVLQVLWLTLLCLTVSPAKSSVAAEGSWVYFAGDPGQYAYGFARPVWASKIRKALVFFGNSHNPIGNNSVRAYDPQSNTWSYLWPNEFKASLPEGKWQPSVGRQQGDNFIAFYVPRLGAAGELWVIGGSGLNDYVNRTRPATDAWYSGVFDVGKANGTTGSGAWVSLSTTMEGAFTSRIANLGGSGVTFNGFGNPSTDWCVSQNTGIIFAGDDGQGNANNRMLIIAPNTPNNGPQPYRIFELKPGRGDLWPDKRMQAGNLGTCDDGHFYYVYGGYNNWGGPHLLNDLWRFNLLTSKWEQLPSGGVTGYQQSLTYDKAQNALIAYGQGPKVSAFYLSSNEWRDVTPTVGLVAPLDKGIGNHGAVYVPTTNEHLFFGGNRVSDGGGAYATVKFKLAGVIPAPSPSTRWPNLPLRTWVSRPLPLSAPSAMPNTPSQIIGSRGYGPTPFGTGAKHQRLVYNPDNKRLYFYSGDWNGGPPFMSSFRTSFYSYDITKSVADKGDYQNWILEWPHCGLTGQVSPTHTDEAAFVYDSKRHVFWNMGGYEVSSEDTVGMCKNRAIFYGFSAYTGPDTSNAQHPPDLLQFNPVTNRWTRPDPKYQSAGNAILQDGKTRGKGSHHAIYNPVTDEIIQFAYDGGSGSIVVRMNAETGAWYRDGLIIEDIGHDGIDGSNFSPGTQFDHEQLALDVVHQYVYVIDTFQKDHSIFRLFRYDLTHREFVNLGDIPIPRGSSQPTFAHPDQFPFYMVPYDSTMLAYDSINNVLLWPASSNAGRPIMMIYHPDTQSVLDRKRNKVIGKNGRWEIDPMNRDKPNEIIFGSNGTFIPELNALVIYGGFGTPNDDYLAHLPGVVAPESYFWLYRYGNGPGERSNSPQ